MGYNVPFSFSLSGLRSQLQQDLHAKRTTRKLHLTKVEALDKEIDDLEIALKRLEEPSILATADEQLERIEHLPPITVTHASPTHVTTLPLQPSNVIHIDSKTHKNMSSWRWLAVIKREFPDREFTTQEAASATGKSQDGTYTALQKLYNLGKLTRRGGKDDPSQHEVKWALAGDLQVYAQPRILGFTQKQS